MSREKARFFLACIHDLEEELGLRLEASDDGLLVISGENSYRVTTNYELDADRDSRHDANLPNDFVSIYIANPVPDGEEPGSKGYSLNILPPQEAIKRRAHWAVDRATWKVGKFDHMRGVIPDNRGLNA